jgi:signal transduction histidine kinase
MNQYFCELPEGRMKYIFSGIFIVLIVLNISSAKAEEPRAIHQQQHIDALSIYKKNADDYVAKNLNRFGLNQLQNYSSALDTMYKDELEDTIQAVKSNYVKAHLTRSTTITSLNSQIRELTVKKEKAKTGYTGLLRKAGIASVIWLVIVLILMQVRSRALKAVQAKLDASKGQLSESESKMQLGKNLLKSSHEHVAGAVKMQEAAAALQKAAANTELNEDNGFTREEADKLKASISELVRAASVNRKITETLITQESIAGPDKVNANLNQLCDQCFDLVYNGVKSEDPDLKIIVSKDLEKNLPPIKLIPEAVNQLLVNVLLNAFQSVKERREKNIKGYVPKVTISTRVLPRFLQVRVHDNGDGMTDDIIQQVSEPYFTKRSASNASGLGMYFAKKIAAEMHQGELKIESEPGNKTDVYIKFFTS